MSPTVRAADQRHAGPAPARRGGLPAHGDSAVRRAGEIHRRARSGHEGRQADLLVAQKQADVDDPKRRRSVPVGTVATILQLLKLPDGTVKVLVEGVDRAASKSCTKAILLRRVTLLPDVERYEEREMDVLARSVITQFEQYVKLNKKVPPEILTSLAGIEQAGRLADTVAAHMSLKLSEKQKVLEILDVRKRLEHMLVAIEGEMDVLQIEKRIRGRVKRRWRRASASTT
jgi:ATP-dependent Lon protease